MSKTRHYHICGKNDRAIDGFLLSLHNCNSAGEAKREFKQMHPDRIFVAILDMDQ